MPTLKWINDDEARQAASRVPYRLLDEVPDLSAGDPHSPNLMIQGDNLDALKALLPYYAGQVKCIYIDPPYNTGSAFTHYEDSLEHSTWLSMMYPRLEILREFLSQEGSLWCSIDDDEGHYIKILLDEIFGRENFVSTVIWQKKYSPQNDARWLSDDHDYILLYARNKSLWRPKLLPRTTAADSRYHNPDNDPRGAWKSTDASVKTYTQNYDYPITTPSGRVVNPPRGRCWFTSPERMTEFIADNRIWFGINGQNVPSLKTFLSEVKEGSVCKTLWLYEEVGHNQEAKNELRKLLEGSTFDTPKPERLIQRILFLSTKEDDLVMDSFLGSGTTAAVALKMGRRFIGIEMGEHAVTHCAPRLRKVIEGEQGGISKSVGWQGGGGYRFLRLGEPLFAEDGKINPQVSFAALAAHVWFSETKLPYHAPKHKSPLLGVQDGTAYYLLFNGVLGDLREHGGNVLTARLLKKLPAHAGPRVIYSEACLLDDGTLKALNITFKKIPYELPAR